ncbi:hypothetical protein CLUG_02452 [Clavispora lusitaniae ATCC 42720]|uniref:Armadillo-like helical domain-containing protein n=1 Tax=Clavispora lusitaniae (strain ATCC 42720) TaxID=306902 RepID=C4Y480_CLAL4|nr:uncharacterized protein CLUG_02452 [Clavispora lusitaniae ATCC 42720]EEQ38326.1 hypothetical protein CLUG_02452 [Clavispora lusitaniae ATCC 42720]
MDLSNSTSDGSPEVKLQKIFANDLSDDDFCESLTSLLTKGAKTATVNASVQLIFRYGVSLICDPDFPTESGFRATEIDYRGSVPEEDLTQQNGHSTQAPVDDGDDITSLAEKEDAKSLKNRNIDSISEARNSSDNSPMIADELDITSRVSEEHENSNEANGVQASVKESLPENKTTDYASIEKVAHVLKLWFRCIRKTSSELKIDLLGSIFGLPGTKHALTERDLYRLLATTKLVMEEATVQSTNAYLTALKELILLTHETLFSIFYAMTLESSNQNSNKFLVIKSLVHTFFQVDLSRPIDELLSITNSSKTLEDHAEDKKAGSLRLSYDTLMRLYTIYYTLTNCPINLLLVDKMSLSLDITTLSNVSANVYTNRITSKDFSSREMHLQINSRVVPLLTANFNYYYQLQPDLLDQHLSRVSFFGWITGHRLIPGSYMATDTISSVTKFPHYVKGTDKSDPFLHETEEFEWLKKKEKVGDAKNSEYAVSSPTYLVISLMMYQLVQNASFVTYLTHPRKTRVPLLDIWLCVSSYVHHYLYKSRVNVFGARISNLILLKLTSTKSDALTALRDYKIDENVWKLCHHRSPPISLSIENSKKSALLYIIDIIQIDLRFNLNKRLDIDNCKITLCILYQILLFCQKNPFDDLRSYCWSELFKALVQFLKFVYKHFNEEDTKYVVEEVFAIFEISLGPPFSELMAKPSDNWIFGSHFVKSLSYDLLYTLLENYHSIFNIFGKFIIKRDNFARVTQCLQDIGEKLSVNESRERDMNEVTKLLEELSSLSNVESTVRIEKYNYAATFKYFDKYQGYIDFEKQTELIEIFILVYGNTWTS